MPGNVLVLRLVHIFAGVFWAGSAMALAGFFEPAIRRSGPEGGRVMQNLATHTRYSMAMGISAALATLAGLWLFWIDSGGLNPAWLSTGTGLTLTIGGAAGIAAAVIGFTVQFRSSRRLERLGEEIARLGGPPTTAQAQELQRRQATLRAGGRWVALLLVVTVVAMATARYLAF
jgi:uncharacterized membrane protein